MLNASVQQVQESSVLHVVTLLSKESMVSEQAPVKVVLMVISGQLEEMVELQEDKVEPWPAALLADLKYQPIQQAYRYRISGTLW